MDGRGASLEWLHKASSPLANTVLYSESEIPCTLPSPSPIHASSNGRHPCTLSYSNCKPSYSPAPSYSGGIGAARPCLQQPECHSALCLPATLATPVLLVVVLAPPPIATTPVQGVCVCHWRPESAPVKKSPLARVAACQEEHSSSLKPPAAEGNKAVVQVVELASSRLARRVTMAGVGGPHCGESLLGGGEAGGGQAGGQALAGWSGRVW